MVVVEEEEEEEEEEKGGGGGGGGVASNSIGPKGLKARPSYIPVSYTHLTLPTRKNV